MKIKQFQIDAFAEKPFEGNPAAVCPLDSWLDERVMQSIAAENNLAETAFFVAEDGQYHIRWFTPEVEVALCGHATLASAHVLFNELGYESDSVSFNSLSGPLRVTRDRDLLKMDFPNQKPEPCEIPDGLAEALGCNVDRCYFDTDYVAIIESEELLSSIKPDFPLLANLNARGVIVTAESTHYDFVNRFFAPQVGINEDPVTGSAFTKLIPLWAERLGINEMKAKQVSKRGGEVFCRLLNDRVEISGKAVLFMRAEIII